MNLRVFLLILVLGVRANAQAPANVRVSVDATGNAEVYFLVPDLPANSAQLEIAMASALGLELKDGSLDIEQEKRVATLTARSKKRFGRKLLTIRGTVRFQPIFDFLRAMQIQWLEFHLEHPKAGFSQISAGNAMTVSTDGVVEYSGEWPIASASRQIEFSFGYSRAAVVRMSALLALIPAALAAVVARKLFRKNQRPAEVRAFPINLIIGLICFVWAAMIWTSGADEFVAFVLNLDSDAGKISALTVLLAMVALCLSSFVRPADHSDGVGAGRLNFACQFGMVPPLIALASGIVASRQHATAKGFEWLGLATVLLAWEIAASYVRVGAVPKRPLASSIDELLSRRTAILSVVFVPAGFVLLARELDWGFAATNASYAAALLCSILANQSTRVRLVKIWRQRNDRRNELSEPARRSGRVLRVSLTLACVGLLSAYASLLFGFSFQIATGGDGWILLLISLTAAGVIEALPWR